jgi:hypothetical protein
MTAKKKAPTAQIETLDAESIALIVSQLSALMHHREDRIIAAVEKMLKPITDTFQSNGGTLDRLLDMIGGSGGLSEKIEAFENRMNSYEKKTDLRIERIEREIAERKKS